MPGEEGVCQCCTARMAMASVLVLSLGIQFQFFSLDCKPVPPCSLGAARELPVAILGDLTVIIKSLQLLSSRRHNSSFFY